MKTRKRKMLIYFILLTLMLILGFAAYYTLSSFSAHFYRINNNLTLLNENVVDIADITIPEDNIAVNIPSDPSYLQDSLSDNAFTIQIANHRYVVDCKNSSQTIVLKEAAVDNPYTVTFNEYPDVTLFVDDVQMQSGDIIIFDSLSKTETLELRIQDSYSIRYYTIQTLPDGVPNLLLTDSYDNDKQIYTTIFPSEVSSNHYMLRMNFDGEITYIKECSTNVKDFAKWEIEGNEYYSYFQGVQDYNNIDIGGVMGRGISIIMDENYIIIDRVELIPSEDYNFTERHIEVHDMIMLAENHYVTMAYVAQNPKPEDVSDDLPADTKVYAAYLQEIKNDKIVWEWLSTDYPDFYLHSVEGNSYTDQSQIPISDYMHINSMFIDPKDDSIIVSARNQDSVFKINRNTNEIEWVLGGLGDEFSMSDEQNFSRQHDASYISDDEIILFDNGNATGVSKAVKIQIDEDSKTILSYDEFSLGINSPACGSLQQLNETDYCIGWGVKADDSAQIMTIFNFETKEIITELFSDTIPLNTYRVRVY